MYHCECCEQGAERNGGGQADGNAPEGAPPGTETSGGTEAEKRPPGGGTGTRTEKRPPDGGVTHAQKTRRSTRTREAREIARYVEPCIVDVPPWPEGDPPALRGPSAAGNGGGAKKKKPGLIPVARKTSEE